MACESGGAVRAVWKPVCNRSATQLPMAAPWARRAIFLASPKPIQHHRDAANHRRINTEGEAGRSGAEGRAIALRRIVNCLAVGFQSRRSIETGTQFDDAYISSQIQ